MTVIAYFLIYFLTQFCLLIGIGVSCLPVALFLAWTNESTRVRISTVVGGIGGVILSVAFGYSVSRLLLGPGSYGLGVFCASAIPLLICIKNDYTIACSVSRTRKHLCSKFQKSEAISNLARNKLIYSSSLVMGEVTGLLLSVTWLVNGLSGSP